MPHLDDELPIDPDLAPDDPGEPLFAPVGDMPGRGAFERVQPGTLAAVAVGGAIGTLARAALEEIFPTAIDHFPTTTLVVNLVGSFALAVVLVVLIEVVGPTRRLQPFVITGVLGGFTTFSAFMVEATQLGRHGHVGAAGSYLVVAVVGGLGAVFAGLAVGRAVVRRVGVETSVDETESVQ